MKKNGAKAEEFLIIETLKGIMIDERPDGRIIKYAYAHDPNAGRRVIHVIKRGWVFSLVSEHKFRIKDLKRWQRDIKIPRL